MPACRHSFLHSSLASLPNVTVCLFGGRTLGGHLGLDHLRSCRMRQPLGVRLAGRRVRCVALGFGLSLVLHESWLSVRFVSSNCAQMHPNTDTTNKAGLIYSRISQVTRIQCELSGRRDSGTALAVVFVYTRSGYVSGHVVAAVASRGDCGAASS
jgi:hypothetical protein